MLRLAGRHPSCCQAPGRAAALAAARAFTATAGAAAGDEPFGPQLLADEQAPPFGWVRHNQRPGKPRKSGLTEIRFVEPSLRLQMMIGQELLMCNLRLTAFTSCSHPHHHTTVSRCRASYYTVMTPTYLRELLEAVSGAAVARLPALLRYPGRHGCCSGHVERPSRSFQLGI